MNKLYSVHDHWTDINKKNDVDIESIDGVITGIKVNGEDYGGGGSSDFSIANVTVINKASNTFQLFMPYIFGNKMYAITNSQEFESGDVLQVPLYKGSIEALSLNSDAKLRITGVGNVITSVKGDVVGITGDCTITIS